MIKRLNFNTEEKKSFIDEILYGFLIENTEFTAFRATLYFKGSYDLPNLSATYFGLTNLLTLEYDFSNRLDRHKIMRFVVNCQIKSGPLKGSFVPTLTPNGDHFGESDLRLCYIATCIRKVLKYDEIDTGSDIDVGALIQYVLKRIQYNGAFSSNLLDEGHLGFTFCGLACLKLLNYDFSSSLTNFNLTRNWLLHRQVDYPTAIYAGQSYEYYEPKDKGSFNGRENKFGDTCYSWWCTASLKVLEPENLKLFDIDSAMDYLLKGTQNHIVGGFQKDLENRPDPFHSFLALASISLWDGEGELGLENVDELLVISSVLRVFLDKMRWDDKV